MTMGTADVAAVPSWTPGLAGAPPPSPSSDPTRRPRPPGRQEPPRQRGLGRTPLRPPRGTPPLAALPARDDRVGLLYGYPRVPLDVWRVVRRHGEPCYQLRTLVIASPRPHGDIVPQCNLAPPTLRSTLRPPPGRIKGASHHCVMDYVHPGPDHSGRLPCPAIGSVARCGQSNTPLRRT